MLLTLATLLLTLDGVKDYTWECPDFDDTAAYTGELIGKTVGFGAAGDALDASSSRARSPSVQAWQLEA